MEPKVKPTASCMRSAHVYKRVVSAKTFFDFDRAVSNIASSSSASNA